MVEDFEVLPRLTQLRLPKDILMDALDRAVGERSNVTASDPAGTGGNEMRRWLIRHLRDEPALKELGWVPCAQEQIEGIRNDELRVKLVVVNTDAATGMPGKLPKNVAEKGTASERVVERNFRNREALLFAELQDSVPDPITLYDHWYFCTFAGEEYVSAEVSRPDGMTAGIFSSFSERIIICRPGDKDGLRRKAPIIEDFAEVDRPQVTFKS
jgi:hypothetical protein